MKNNKFINNSIHYFISLSLIISGLLKLIGFAPYQEMIHDLSPYYTQYIYLLGSIAILAGILFLIPRTFTLGFIITLVFLGGTISAHMQHGDNFIPQILFVLLTTLVVYQKRRNWFIEPITQT